MTSPGVRIGWRHPYGAGSASAVLAFAPAHDVVHPQPGPATTYADRVGRMRGVLERPEGLDYRADMLSPDEEREVLAVVERLDLREVQMRGQTARRTVQHFDLEYGYESWQLAPAEPLPESLEWLRERCAEFAGIASAAFAQTLVTRYPPGATIGWHRDAPVFGPVVVGVSLRAACLLRFQRRVGEQRRVYEAELAPRSAYLLTGSARSAWQHSIPPVPALRYSITFRTLRRQRQAGGPAARSPEASP